MRYGMHYGTQADAHLLELGCDLSQVSRMDSIMGRRYDVIDMIDNVAMADHRCLPEDGCEGQCLKLAPSDQLVLSRVGWVYAHLDQNAEIIYIGKTDGRLQVRTKQHYCDETSARFSRIVQTRRFPEWIVGWNVGDGCRRLEKAAILVMQPVLNSADLT